MIRFRCKDTVFDFSGWNQYGELFCDTILFSQVYLIARRETEENGKKKMVNVCHQITTER
jgi:hypothetical protein